METEISTKDLFEIKLDNSDHFLFGTITKLTATFLDNVEKFRIIQTSY